jgi:hypothetical protein
MGLSTSPTGSGRSNSPSVSVSPSPTAQSRRPSGREMGNRTRTSFSYAQLRKGRVFGSSAVER